MNFYGTGNRPSIMCWVAPRLRAPSRVYRPTRACRRVFVVVAPDTRPIVPARRFEALHRRQLCTAPRRRRFAAMTTLTLGFGAAVAPASFRARVPARHARPRALITRARAQEIQDEEVRPTPRASVPARRSFSFSGCLPPSRDSRARLSAARGAFTSSLPSLTPSPSAIPPPVPLARGEALPGLRVAPRRHVRVSPPLRRRVIRPVPSPRLRRRGSRRRRRPPPPPRTGTRPDDDRPHHRRRDGFGFSDKFWFSDSTPRETVRGGVLRGVGDVFARVVARRANREGRPRASGTIRTRTRKRRQGAQIGADGSRGAPPRPRGG